MLNPNPDKIFEDYKKKINKEAFYRDLKRRAGFWFNSITEKFLGLVMAILSVAYISAMAYVVAHFVIKFW